MDTQKEEEKRTSLYQPSKRKNPVGLGVVIRITSLKVYGILDGNGFNIPFLPEKHSSLKVGDKIEVLQ